MTLFPAERHTKQMAEESAEEQGAGVNIYLFRHGETEWNRVRRLQGQSDVALNAFGRELAVKTAEALRETVFDRAFCSPLSRAAETAEIILGGRATPLVRDERLKEMFFGEHEGDAFDEAKQSGSSHPLHNFFCDPEHYIPPTGAESFQDIMDRGREFLQERIVPLEEACENVLIVAHGAFNRGVLSAVCGIPLRDFWRLSLPNCAATILTLEKGNFRILEESRIYYENPVNGKP